MFNIGDRILYPMHGAGVVDEIKEIDIMGTKQNYYVLKIFVGNLTVQIPVANAEGLGVRYVVGEDTADRVLELLESREPSPEEDNNWSKRYRANLDLIKEGDIFEVALIVKTLMLRDKEKSLSTGERKMLSTAKHILVSEMACSKNIDADKMDRIITERILGT